MPPALAIATLLSSFKEPAASSASAPAACSFCPSVPPRASATSGGIPPALLIHTVLLLVTVKIHSARAAASFCRSPPLRSCSTHFRTSEGMEVSAAAHNAFAAACREPYTSSNAIARSRVSAPSSISRLTSRSRCASFTRAEDANVRTLIEPSRPINACGLPSWPSTSQFRSQTKGGDDQRSNSTCWIVRSGNVCKPTLTVMRSHSPLFTAACHSASEVIACPQSF
mmetsp:Transcript_12252/g.40352  ORF Transcript_12252/g.40352 Transcript_12252/m.40352 type:complete len:226 (-) Transcript_12252:85-762(-)